MDLLRRDLARGKKFLVGKWRVDYLVNFFSNDLAHIPAVSFKSDDGRDFSALSFEFFDDNTFAISDESKEDRVRGEWTQTDLFEYEWHFDSREAETADRFLQNASKLSVYEGDLTFALGFLTVALKRE